MTRSRSNVVPLRKSARGPRNPWPKAAKWTRAQDYGVRRSRGAKAWTAAMIALPLAAFTAVFVWDGPPQAGAVTAIADTGAPLPRGWDASPESLDGQQPSAGGIGGAAVSGPAVHFGLCAGMGRRGGNCVVDGDTFWYGGEKIRIADINTPEVSDPGCPSEAALGARATERLQALLNQGAFALETVDRDRDKYGRLLRVVTRGGESVGGVLVAEGLAEEWQGYRRDWC